MLLSEEESKIVWDEFYKKFQFKPSIHKNIPFQINVPYVVYDISNVKDMEIDKMEEIIPNIFRDCTKKGEMMYALDWQHSCFKFNPHNPIEMRNIEVEDEECFKGGYITYFPSFYPDGDYSFFLSCDFTYGYLSHPWQQKVWIFGENLIKKFEEVSEVIGFVKI